MADKRELRRHIRALKRQHTDTLPCQSSRLCELLRQHPAVVSAQVLMAYHPLPDEADISPLLPYWAAQGKTVLLPQVVADGEMVLRRYDGPESLLPGAYGILEPIGELFTQYEDIGTVVVPGMAFDRAGHRLGRGKGYYDRLLPQLSHSYKIGVCFDFQLVDSVPSEPHDVVVDEVLW